MTSRVWALIASCAVIAALFGVFSDAHWRASASFLGALVLGGTLLIGGTIVVHWFADAAPSLSIVIALMTYLTTIAVFAAVLAAADPDVLDGPGFAAGLVVIVVAATIRQWRIAQEQQQGRGPA